MEVHGPVRLRLSLEPAGWDRVRRRATAPPLDQMCDSIPAADQCGSSESQFQPGVAHHLRPFVPHPLHQAQARNTSRIYPLLHFAHPHPPAAPPSG